jgi:hypothetical protein
MVSGLQAQFARAAFWGENAAHDFSSDKNAFLKEAGVLPKRARRGKRPLRARPGLQTPYQPNT